MKLLFVGKEGNEYCARAAAEVRRAIPDALIVLGRRGAPWPADIDSWSGDYLISYLSPHIIPRGLLESTSRAAINFHPGPPEYPGIGCTNFALYDEVDDYGITCHHMTPRVDTGSVIAVRRFAILPDDSVFALTQRCYEHIYELFGEIFALIKAGKELPTSAERWTRQPYKREELQKLCEIRPEMSDQEIARRVRATTFPGAPGAFVEVGGFRFEYRDKAS